MSQYHKKFRDYQAVVSRFLPASFPLLSIWLSYQSTVLCLCSRIPKNTESDFSTAYSPYQQRKKPFGTGYFSVHSGSMASSNSMGVKKCSGQLQANGRFGFFSSLLYGDRAYLDLTFFIRTILSSSHLN